MSFEAWLAALLGEDVSEVTTLLRYKRALKFLIAWSLFESKCFKGFMRKADIESFAKRVSADKSFDQSEVAKIAKRFHERYQDKNRYRNLLHNDSCPEMESLLGKPFESLKSPEIVFLATFTVYRYRNNIFHGNKGVHSWLKFGVQIDQCTEVMKILVDHAEAKTPGLLVAA